MTTFQAVILGIIQGFTEFLPLGPDAHQIVAPFLLNWPTPDNGLLGILALGTLLALLIHFRHDWASIISSFLSVLIFRKRPMTIDERMPLFLGIATIPTAVAWYYLHERLGARITHPVWIAAELALFGIPMVLAERMNRRTKKMLDWNWLDSLIFGIFQIFMLIPGCGRMAAGMAVAGFRNYNREAGAKFALLAGGPILAAEAVYYLRGFSTHAAGSPTTFTLIVALVVTTLCGLLAIGGFMKHVQKQGFGQYLAYRWLLAIVIVAVYWARNKTLL